MSIKYTKGKAYKKAPKYSPSESKEVKNRLLAYKYRKQLIEGEINRLKSKYKIK